MNIPSRGTSILVVALMLLTTAPAFGDCKCRRPERDEQTRWGRNQSVVIAPEDHFREVKGIVGPRDHPMKDILVEVFDKPDYLKHDGDWKEGPQQTRLRVCVTGADGKFCF